MRIFRRSCGIVDFRSNFTAPPVSGTDFIRDCASSFLVPQGAAMRLLTLGSLGAPLLLILAACTAQGSSTTVQGPGGTSGAPVFPALGDGTTDGGTTDTGTTDYAALFGPPASTDTTPNSLNGLWAGTSGSSSTDTRVKFTGASIVIALKCGSNAIGIDVVAHVTSSSIKTLESKSYTPPPTSGGTTGGTKTSASTCSLTVMPLEVPRCTSTTDTDADYESTMLDSGCFFLSGTKLSFYSSTSLIGAAKLTKLSD
jgi:hypothetical protein